jgi:hypothetical protein
MGDLEARLNELVKEHEKTIVGYHKLLLGTTKELLKDSESSGGVKGSLLGIFDSLDAGYNRQTSSKLTSGDRVKLAETVLQNGESLARILNDSVFDSQVKRIENEIKRLNGEIESVERMRERARVQKKPVESYRLGSKAKRLKKIKK